MKIKLFVKILVFAGLVLLAGGLYLMNQEINTNEGKCPTCGTKTPESSENNDDGIFEDEVQSSAVSTPFQSGEEYFNWVPENSCPEGGNCYLENITALVTFLNTGDSSVVADEGTAYIQIANTEESNCQDPSQAIFTRYIAYSPAMAGGESQTKKVCGDPATPNTCNMTEEDGFWGNSECFSVKIIAPNIDDGTINLVAHLLSVDYAYETE